MSSYTEGQVHQLADKLEAEYFSADDITRLGQFPNLSGVRAAVRGQAKIVPLSEDASRWFTINPTTIAVNLGAAPRLPFNGAGVIAHEGSGWAVLEKRADGQLYMNDRKVVLYLSRRQRGGKWLKGHELREELTGLPVLNANLLDALADNPHLIPEDWKTDEWGNTRYIFFWGTVYRDADGRLYVHFLGFDDGAWHRRCPWLGGDWHGRSPAASLASI